MTVEQYLKTWLTKMIPGTASERTEEIYARVVRRYLVQNLGKIRLNKLTPTDMNAMMIELGERGLSPSTKGRRTADPHRAAVWVFWN